MHSSFCLPTYGGMATVLLPTSQVGSVTFPEGGSLPIIGETVRAIVVTASNPTAEHVLLCFYLGIGSARPVYVYQQSGTVARYIVPHGERVMAVAFDDGSQAIAWTEQLQSLERDK